MDGCRAQEGRDQRVGGEQRARALTDPRDDRFLVGKRRASRVVRDLLKPRHPGLSRLLAGVPAELKVAVERRATDTERFGDLRHRPFLLSHHAGGGELLRG
jgi:hypothetical protein